MVFMSDIEYFGKVLLLKYPYRSSTSVAQDVQSLYFVYSRLESSRSCIELDAFHLILDSRMYRAERSQLIVLSDLRPRNL